VLVASRFGQGLGEALASPAAHSHVVLLFLDEAESAKASGMWGDNNCLGATIGVVVSGMIVTWLNWRWIFLVNLPVALFVVFVVPRMVTESRMSGERKVDYLGAIFVTGGLTLVVDGMLNAADHGWGSTNVLIPLLAGVALLIAFVISQLLVRVPLVPLRFFRNRTRVSANIATILAGAGFLAMFFTVTLYMQDVLHYSALKSGLAWGPFGLMLLFGFGATMKILPRTGIKPALIASFLISALGLYLLSGISVHDSYATGLLPGMLVMAFGQSISFVGLQNSALHKLGPTDAGLGSAMQNTSLQIGGSLGLAVLVTIALRHTASQLSHGIAPAVAATDGYVWALRLGAAVLVLGAIFVATLFERVHFIPPEQAALEVAEAAAGELPDIEHSDESATVAAVPNVSKAVNEGG
jgi:predicted MFS family arabinose efflux permease